MGTSGAPRRSERQRVQDLNDALGASLDLHEVLSESYRLLLPLVGADYGALAVTRAERRDEYEWIVQNLPPAFLGSYRDMAPHDFVHRAVMSKPNLVVRDAQMIDRRALERNMMYGRAREVGAPIEQVMAVMLHVEGGWRSGLSLYRDRRRPFTRHEQCLLQQLTPAIGNAVRNCRRYGSVSRWAALVETLLGADDEAVVLVQPPSTEVERTSMATALLDAWFSPVERSAGSLPRILLDQLEQARVAHARGKVGSWFWKRVRDGEDLAVEIFPVPQPGGVPPWALRLRTRSHVLPVPASFRALLSPREVEVVSGVLQGWDNPLIAEHVGCEPATVKKHLQSIFTKLGVESRSRLMALAARER